MNMYFPEMKVFAKIKVTLNYLGGINNGNFQVYGDV